MKSMNPNLEKSALKENLELRVAKAQMQLDLKQVRKALESSEKLAESLRKQMREGLDRLEKDQQDQALRDQLDSLQQAYDQRQAEIDDLKQQLEDNDERDEEVGKLRDLIEDLEAELRDKQRVTDEKDDEFVGRPIRPSDVY